MSSVVTSTGLTHYHEKIKTLLAGKSDTNHTHLYAGSTTAGGAAKSVASSITIKLNSGSTEGTNMFTFNGSAAKTVNITAANVGAATSSHNHDTLYLKLTGGTVTGVTSFTNTTASTSTTTGAVKVSGGLGVAGRMTANEVGIGNGAVMKYDTTNKCINFVFS